jgi:hypothetical protein
MNITSNHANLMIDMVLELFPEMLDEAAHGPRRRLAEGADGSAFDFTSDAIQQI